MADRYLVLGGTGDYDSTTNWSTASGGASGASKPVAADRIIIDANSFNAPLTVNTANDCLSFTASNYTGTLTLNNILQTNGTLALGDITLSAGMTVTGNGTFAKKGTGTTGRITSNGAIFDCHFSFTNTVACTTLINGAMQVNKNISSTLNSITATTINTGTISVGGNIIHNNPFGGTSTLQMIGSNTATITQVAGRYLSTNLIFNKTGIINQVDLYWGGTSRVLTYTAGVYNHTGTLFTVAGATLNTNGMTWNAISLQSGILNFTSLCRIITFNGTTAPSFRGTFGFNVDNFNYTLAGTTVQFESGLTYTFNSSITIVSSSGNSTIVAARLASNAILNVKETASVKLNKVTMQKITASNKTIRALNATVDTACINVFLLTSNINPYSTTR